MSGVYILKNVYNFAQILNLSTTEQLRKWDESTLQKALQWAQYCEEVYKHVLQQGYAEDMNPKIVQLTVVLTPSSFLTYNFDCLRVATKLIVEAVLTNPNGSHDLQKSLKSYVDLSVLSEVTQKIKARSSLSDLDKVFAIFWIQHQTYLQTIKDRDVSTYTKIFFKNILDVMKTTENEQRFQRYCTSLFDRLIALDRGWEMLVHMFCFDPDHHSMELEEMIEAVMSIILSWMCVKSKDIIKCPILELDLKVLQKASVCSSGFLQFYLSSLENWGQSFQPCIGGLGGELWRDKNDTGASHLSKHFHYLLNHSTRHNSGKDFKSHILTFLGINVKSSDFTVWRVVANSLLSK